MRLYNVDQEHWEEVATQDIAPSSALAYETQTALWISTETELEAVSHHGGGTLRYTQRGLDLLRNGGYEG